MKCVPSYCQTLFTVNELKRCLDPSCWRLKAKNQIPILLSHSIRNLEHTVKLPKKIICNNTKMKYTDILCILLEWKINPRTFFIYVFFPVRFLCRQHLKFICELMACVINCNNLCHKVTKNIISQHILYYYYFFRSKGQQNERYGWLHIGWKLFGAFHIYFIKSFWTFNHFQHITYGYWVCVYFSHIKYCVSYGGSGWY